MKRFLRTFFFATAIAGLAFQSAAAAPITFEATWLGQLHRTEPHGGSGRFTFDDSLLSETMVSTSNPLFHAMDLSFVSPYGNRTYDKTDYAYMVFRGMSGLDYSR